ncbi:hypothetical protein ACJRO7_035756 [Eucalyptus globulus]|uniref:C2H2-type domain-containing protein n=1 Tax=Eucalyptus globulus TaxID=34317 RepID=A0ABD3JDZ7_EUCGL
MSNPHDKLLDQKHGTSPGNGSSRLENSVPNPPDRPPHARRVGDARDDTVVAVSWGSDMMTEVTGWGSSAPRSGRRLWRQCREPDPPAEVAQAAQVPRRKTNHGVPELPRSCSVCSLKFYGWRELFAHMRTHLEKESRCMRESFPPLDSSVEGEARDRGSGVEGRELASTLLHMSPRANEDRGDQNAAFSTAGSQGTDAAAAASQGADASGSAAHASPPRRGLGFKFDLNKPPPEEEDDNDDHGGSDLKKLPPKAEEGGGR